MGINGRYSFEGKQVVKLVGGLLCFGLILLLSPPPGLSQEAWNTAAVAVLMAIWWITEAIPISATAFVPIVLLPILGVESVGKATAPYANPLIFLFLGGFLIAEAMQEWNLHRRIALNIVHFMGTRTSSLIMGFMLASAFLSMWVSNTATAMMMTPIALSVLDHIERQKEQVGQGYTYNFELVLVLAIAYACNVGGVGTLVGTPPNAILSGYMLENYNVEISFVQWLGVGLPFVIVSIPLIYLVLTKLIYPIKVEHIPGGARIIENELKNLGRISNTEVKVSVVFGFTALLWITRPLLDNIITGLSDAGIAMGMALLLFLIPVQGEKDRFLLKAKNIKNLPWDVLILFGGGLSLASAIDTSGLPRWIGQSVQNLGHWPVILMLLAVTAMVVFLTEVTSNTATTAAFIPILASAAIGMNQNPLLIIVPATISASCAFMLPVATPPNAIVYGSGKISVPEMSRAGLWLNILFILVITLLAYTLISWVFQIQIGQLPKWAGIVSMNNL